MGVSDHERGAPFAVEVARAFRCTSAGEEGRKAAARLLGGEKVPVSIPLGPQAKMYEIDHPTGGTIEYVSKVIGHAGLIVEAGRPVILTEGANGTSVSVGYQATPEDGETIMAYLEGIALGFSGHENVGTALRTISIVVNRGHFLSKPGVNK